MKKTLIAIPTMGTIHTGVVDWAVSQNAPLFFTDTITPVSFARNTIVETFLKTEYDYLMMVDSDTIPPKDALERLEKILDEGADVATGITKIIKRGKACPNVYKNVEDVEKCEVIDDTKPFEVAGCGASCLMVSRKTLEKMEKPYFKSIEFDNGMHCSEDLYFCEKAKKIVCDPQVKCYHLKTVSVS